MNEAQIARESREDDGLGRRFAKGLLMGLGAYVALIAMVVIAMIVILHMAERLGGFGG